MVQPQDDENFKSYVTVSPSNCRQSSDVSSDNYIIASLDSPDDDDDDDDDELCHNNVVARISVPWFPIEDWRMICTSHELIS